MYMSTMINIYTSTVPCVCCVGGVVIVIVIFIGSMLCMEVVVAVVLVVVVVTDGAVGFVTISHIHNTPSTARMSNGEQRKESLSYNGVRYRTVTMDAWYVVQNPKIIQKKKLFPLFSVYENKYQGYMLYKM